jgi:hypothetical protein
MWWMRTRLSALDAGHHGQSILRSAIDETSSATHAECKSLWLSSMASKSACHGRVTLIQLFSIQCLMESYSSQALEPVGTRIV